jgi:hypothetical protein
MLSGRPWIIEENSLFLQTMGKAVLLNKIECCGKVVTELRQTVMFGVSPTTRKKIFICFPSSRITPWGMFVGGSTLLGLGTALATTILFGKS